MILVPAILCGFLAVSASAQTPVTVRTGGEAAANAPARQEVSVRIQSSISFLLPGPTNESEEAQKLRDRAKRLVYEMASHECDILRETLAKDCKLETVNSNLARQQYGNQQEGYNVNGQLSLVVTLK
jgi:hypothetical protein